MRNTIKDPGQTVLDFSDDNFLDGDGNIDYNKVYILAFRDFNKLKLVYSFEDIQIRDLREMDWGKKYMDFFNSSFFEEFEDRIEYLNADWEVRGNLENECYYFKTFKSNYELIDYLRLNVSETEEDEDLTDGEIIKKYSREVKIILADFRKILKIYSRFYSFHYESGVSEMFIASAIVYKLRIDWMEWKELSDLISNH